MLFTTLFALQPDDTPWYMVLLVVGIAMMFTSVLIAPLPRIQSS